MSHGEDDRRDELAARRTEAAFHRTLLAEQRTYSERVRTRLALTATGFAIAKLMTETEPAWVVRALAIVFVLVGACMFWLAFWAYRGALAKIDDLPAGGIPLWTLGILSLALFIAAVTGLYSFLEDPINGR
jgi:uncharacterized membrane protein YidH (DUF202 family)